MANLRNEVRWGFSNNENIFPNLIEDDEERSEPRRDELDADAERDDELVGGDGEEEVPNVGGLRKQGIWLT